MGPDEEAELSGSPSRTRRAKTLVAISLAVVVIAGAAYLRPAFLPAAATPVPAAPGLQLDAVDFIDPSTGWVLADIDDRQFAVLSTKDAGRHWSTELLQATLRQGEYMRFFDRNRGVVVTVGGEPVTFTTQDGGASWTRHEVADVSSFAISASFADPLNGWVLLDSGDGLPLDTTSLVHTVDGGVTWTRIGETLTTLAQPLAVTFSDAQHGWLDAVAPSAIAYTTSDAGSTWHSVALPSPMGGWPVPRGSFFVAVRSTLDGGLIASVVNSATANGRNASGISVLGYPPLTVKTYDGGSPVVYVYSTFADTASVTFGSEHRPGPIGQLQAANQVVMSSLDGGSSWNVVLPPAGGGTMGFAGARDWWWVGPGIRATTHDGGATWTPATAGQLAQPLAGSLVVLDERHAWITALTGGAASLFTTSDGGDHWTAVELPSVRP
jgi:photosystem II stability/assembly factor-like uncharacterized protein